jgi:glycerol-3-phosphate acyltransferase PlsY
VAISAFLLVCALSFLLGSIPFGLIVGRLFFRTDIRATGSGNVGAANALRAYGKGGAALVLVLDILKGFVPVAVTLGARAQAPPDATAFIHGLAVAAGFCALLGHCYSPWLGFRGGKGVATHLGVVFALSWPAGLAFIAVWAAVALSTGYSSAGSLAATLLSALTLWAVVGRTGLAYGVAAAIVIVWRHRENIERLRTGAEHRIRGQSRAAGHERREPT